VDYLIKSFVPDFAKTQTIFEVLTAALKKIQVFWSVTLCLGVAHYTTAIPTTKYNIPEYVNVYQTYVIL
jgi:hypothetical protein